MTLQAIAGNGQQSLVLRALEFTGAVFTATMASTIQHAIAPAVQQASATATFPSVQHFMYRCKLAGDTVIKYFEVVLGKATSKLSSLANFIRVYEIIKM